MKFLARMFTRRTTLDTSALDASTALITRSLNRI